MASLFRIRTCVIFMLLIITFICSGLNIYASEIDSYTKTQSIHKDAIHFINREINKLINISVHEANQKNRTNPDTLYRILNRNLGGNIVSHLEKNIEQKNTGEVLKIDLKESIYCDLGFLQAPSLRLSRKVGGVFKADGAIIGTDKLGHFIAQGFNYYKICYLKNSGFENALLYGIKSELTYYGFTTTGVFSYGDLVANFQGMRFWNDLLGNYTDILYENISPYIHKTGGKWIVAHPVDMRRYFDAAWDERINRNVFSDPKLNNRINNRIKCVKSTANSPGPEKVKQLMGTLNKKYKSFSTYLLNFGNMSRYNINLLKLKLKYSRDKSLLLKKKNIDNYSSKSG